MFIKFQMAIVFYPFQTIMPPDAVTTGGRVWPDFEYSTALGMVVSRKMILRTT